MPSDKVNPLVGTWEKTAVSKCSEPFPDHLVFQENGLYFGHRRPAGTFTTWDAGKYEIVAPGRVRISTANDAIIAYGFVVAAGTLTFVDPESCTFAYRRAGT